MCVTPSRSGLPVMTCPPFPAPSAGRCDLQFVRSWDSCELLSREIKNSFYCHDEELTLETS